MASSDTKERESPTFVEEGDSSFRIPDNAADKLLVENLLQEVRELSALSEGSLAELKCWRARPQYIERASDSGISAQATPDVSDERNDIDADAARVLGSALDAAQRLSAARIRIAPSLSHATAASRDGGLPESVTAATIRQDSIALHAKMIANARLAELGLTPDMEESESVSSQFGRKS